MTEPNIINGKAFAARLRARMRGHRRRIVKLACKIPRSLLLMSGNLIAEHGLHAQYEA